jgi:hypothetical protein
MNPALSLSRVTGPQTLRDAKVWHFNPASRVAFANLPLIRIYSTRLTYGAAACRQISPGSPRDRLTFTVNRPNYAVGGS